MSHTVLHRLLKYPHAAVFDQSPAPELALRLRNPAGLVWEVTGTTLHLVTGQNLAWDGTQNFNGEYDWGLTVRDYSLLNKTIGDLADDLRADGHDVVFENEAVASRGAHVLVAASGNQDTSNGDHLNAYTSLMWCLFDAYALELENANYEVDQALRQMVMTRAEDIWLDVWASLYGVPRLPGETDAQLQARIPQEVFRLRVNGLAIEKAVTNVAGETVRIDEPWKRMFELDSSALSGTHHMQDGRYYTYHVIQPVGSEGTDWSRALPVVERNKAAGIEIYAPRVDFPAREIILQPPVEYRIERGLMESRGSGIYGTNDQILGVMRLSDNEITVNHLCSRQEWWTLVEAEGLQTAQQIKPHRTIAMASIPLSDGDPLGDTNAILSRGAASVAFDPQPIPSDLMYLSNYSATTNVELVEMVTIQTHGALVPNTFSTDPGTAAHTDILALTNIEEAYPLRIWSGTWGAYPWRSEWRVAGMKRTDTTV